MKQLLTLFFILCVLGAATHTARAQTPSMTLLTAQTTTTSACSSSRAVRASAFPALRTFLAGGTTSAGAGAATVVIYGSNLGTTYWVELGTVTLTLATTITFGTGTGGFVSQAPWPYVCAHVSAISGTGASVDVTMGMGQ
jgi:hypothetical protein